MPEPEQYEKQHEVLDPQKLMNEARSITGLSDFGGTFFVKPLTRFLDRAARELDFNAAGLLSTKADVVRCLVNRLQTEEDIRLHPEILDEDVSDPLIIIGLPRSGTTKLQRMIASAPDVQKLFMWRLLNPARFPDAISGQPDPRMAAAGMEANIDSSDAVRAAHAMAAGLVEEEFVLFDFTFDETVTGWASRLPLFYSDWELGEEREADMEAYRYVKKLLQYLQWQDGGKRDRPLIMKAVMHLHHMDALTECFPNATLVHCHRDPQSAIPSVAKLMWSIWSSNMDFDKIATGKAFMEWASAGVKRYLESRKRLSLDQRILDVRYEDVRDDTMSIIRTIYQRAGWQLTDEAEQAMMQWEKENEQGKHGKHVYSLEEFGLNKKAIDQAFAEYIARFIRN